MDAFAEHFSCHFSEQRQHAHVSRGNRGRAGHQKDESQQQNRKLQDSFPDAAQIKHPSQTTPEFKPWWIWHFLPPSRGLLTPRLAAPLHSVLRKMGCPAF